MRQHAFMTLARHFASCQRGATALEYALLASLIGVVIIGALTALGTSLESSYDNSTNAIQ